MIESIVAQFQGVAAADLRAAVSRVDVGHRARLVVRTARGVAPWVVYIGREQVAAVRGLGPRLVQEIREALDGPAENDECEELGE